MSSTPSTGTGPQPVGLAEGVIKTVAGTGAYGYVSASDNGPGGQAQINYPRGVAMDKNGNLYIADTNNNRVRKVTPDGIITTFAGNGTTGDTKDNVPATSTSLNRPWGVVADDAGNVYIADSRNQRVRKVAPDGIITTFAGDGTTGQATDNVPATSTSLDNPAGLAVDNAGNLYIADYRNQQVHKVDPDGIITTFAGNGTTGETNDNVPATSTSLSSPAGLAVDNAGNLYIADTNNNRVRRVTPDGIITTIAGNGTTEDTKDDVPATSTSLNRPWGVTLDEAGTLYITDTNNNRVRTVSPDGIITTIAGNGTTENTKDDVPATSTSLNRPNGVAVDRAGNLYIAENYGHRIRGVTGVARMAPALTPAADLYGEVVSPFRVQRGQEFDLGARIRNRGPNPADGQYVTVVLTLADGLVGGPGTTGRRLARTFTGQQLPPYQGSLDGVLRACAPESALPGIYECTLEIQYSGDLNLKNNTYPLPITVVVPAPVADEKALTVYQDTLADVAPGQHTAFTMRYTSPADQPVNPGTITQRYTAPSGFVFTGQPTYAYYETIDGVIAGNLDHRIEDGGRTLIITANPHVNTSTSDNGSLIYIIPVQARPDAVPGRYDDGSASIGHHTPVQISGKITGAGRDETALRVRQESVPAASPGQSVKFNLEIRSLDNQPVNPGTIEQRITAPTGFAFTGAASFGYYGAKPYLTGNLDAQIEDGGKTLVIRSNPHLNTGTTDKSPLIHTLTVRALPDATPGTQPNDGRAAIGSLTPVSLTGRIL